MLHSLKISCPSCGVLHGYTGLENTESKCRKRYKKKPRHTTKKQSPNGIRKLRVYPSKELHQKWKQWLAAYRWIYNWAIAYLEKEQPVTAFTLQKIVTADTRRLTQMRRIFVFIRVYQRSSVGRKRSAMQSKIARKAERPDWVKELPGHQLSEAVSEAVDAANRAKADKGFARFKSCRATSQAIKFKVGNFRNSTWYPKLIKGLHFTTNQKWPQECIYGTQLVYQRGKWDALGGCFAIACFPEYREETNSGNSRVIALDPGNRTFLTGYDGENILGQERYREDQSILYAS